MEHLKHILFIDIETVPLVHNYNALTEALQIEWTKKSRFVNAKAEENVEPSVLFGEKAGIFSEFAKVVCIVVGSLQKDGEVWKLRIKSLANDDEKVLLNDFKDLILRFAAYHAELVFCGHNIKEFDLPFLCRRMIINSIPLPQMMQLSGKRPWEVSHIDTMELWKFGDYKHFTSLALLAAVLGIPSPKDDMDGSMVGDVYWNDGDLPRIAKYCMQDVLTTARVFLRLKGIEATDLQGIFVNE